MFSAPRGGPPRHWSNENLQEALKNVWSGKMKTAQASRVFGIPYNSLLMYVRGKYGKSLKLDLIKKGKIPESIMNESFSPQYSRKSNKNNNAGGVLALLNQKLQEDSDGALNMVIRENEPPDHHPHHLNLVAGGYPHPHLTGIMHAMMDDRVEMTCE